MDRYLNLRFWFLSEPITEKTAMFLLIFLGLMVILGISIKIWMKTKGKKADHLLKTILKRLVNLLLYMGVIGLVLDFFFYEGAFFVSFKFWFIVWLLITVWWAVQILRSFLKIAAQREEIEKRKKYEKYLPKKS